MHSIQYILVRYFLIILGLLVGAFAFMLLPLFDSWRTAISYHLKIEQNGLWFIILVALAISKACILWRLIYLIHRPLQELINLAESKRMMRLDPSRFRLDEGSRIRYVIDLLNSRIDEIMANFSELESRNREMVNDLEISQSECDQFRRGLEHNANSIAELLEDIRRLTERNQDLEEKLIDVRKFRVDVEVEKRSDEIYTQMEKAIEANALKSIWLPDVVRKLEIPTNEIHSITDRLTRRWANTSISVLHNEVLEIKRQSERQLDCFKALVQSSEEQETLQFIEESAGCSPRIILEIDDQITAIDKREINRKSDKIKTLIDCLLKIALERNEEGNIKLTIFKSDGYIEFWVVCTGAAYTRFELNLLEVKTLAVDLDSHIDADLQIADQLILRFKYRLDLIDLSSRNLADLSGEPFSINTKQEYLPL